MLKKLLQSTDLTIFTKNSNGAIVLCTPQPVSDFKMRFFTCPETFWLRSDLRLTLIHLVIRLRFKVSCNICELKINCCLFQFDSIKISQSITG